MNLRGRERQRLPKPKASRGTEPKLWSQLGFCGHAYFQLAMSSVRLDKMITSLVKLSGGSALCDVTKGANTCWMDLLSQVAYHDTTCGGSD